MYEVIAYMTDDKRRRNRIWADNMSEALQYARDFAVREYKLIEIHFYKGGIIDD